MFTEALANQFLSDRVTRLVNEYDRAGTLVIGVDFDDTVFPHKFDSEEYRAFYGEVIKLLKVARYLGCKIVCYTSRAVENHDQVVEHFIACNLPIVGVNHNITNDTENYRNSKMFTNILIDDRAGMFEALAVLSAFMGRIIVERNRDSPDIVDNMRNLFGSEYIAQIMKFSNFP